MFRIKFTGTGLLLMHRALICSLLVACLISTNSVYAQNLDDLTMKVIGLDEIPGDSFQIEIPSSALENMADLNEVVGTTAEPVEDALAAPSTGDDAVQPEQ